MKNGLPFLFVLLIAGLMTAGCDLFNLNPHEDDYDIRGSWDVTLSAGSDSLTVLMVFSGTKDSGTVLIDFTIEGDVCSHSGTYSVVQGKKVTITWITEEPCMEEGHIIMDGEFSDEDMIKGTAEFSRDPGLPVNWTAKRR